MSFDVKFILHPTNNSIRKIKLFKEIKEIKNNQPIIFKVKKNIFNEFQSSFPTKLFLYDNNFNIILKCNINLIKENNTYHLFEGRFHYSFELLFLEDYPAEIIVENNIKIKEHDKCGKFVRYSLVNINDGTIKINDVEINLFNFKPKDAGIKSNSFHYSFYNIKKQYIISKKINIIKDLSISIYYRNKYHTFKRFSDDLTEYCLNLKNKTILYDSKQANDLFASYQNDFKNILNINLHLPKEKLQILLNEDKYVEFFFLC